VRIRWLEVAADGARRRSECLARALQASAPLEAYRALVEKHAALCAEQRRWARGKSGREGVSAPGGRWLAAVASAIGIIGLKPPPPLAIRRRTEEQGDAVAAGSEELLAAREEIARLAAANEKTATLAAELR
jgi:hypothetical protein